MLGIRLTEKAIATKAVPIVGAGIGAAWNCVEIQAVGNRAVAYHLGLDSPGTRARKQGRVDRARRQEETPPAKIARMTRRKRNIPVQGLHEILRRR